MIYFTSDLHFFHNREFIYKERGFGTIQSMQEAYINEWNNKLTDNDDIYVVGDFCLGSDLDIIRDLVRKLPGKIHLIIGNHDTNSKIQVYSEIGIECLYADMIKYNKRSYYISHYPTLLNSENCKFNGRCIINLHGHIHTKEKFYKNLPYMFNVSVDSNNNKIISIDEIEKMIIEKARSVYLKQKEEY